MDTADYLQIRARARGATEDEHWASAADLWESVLAAPGEPDGGRELVPVGRGPLSEG